MDHTPNRRSAEGGALDSAPTGILLTRDLIFTSKITGTASQLGCRVLVASNKAKALTMIEHDQPQVVFLDLSAGDLTTPEALEDYRKVASPKTHFLAFGPHVDAELLTAARRVGCEMVMVRSEFSARLPDLIRRFC